MRILQMTHQGDEGGSTNSIAWLARGLAERGHEVFLACRPESLLASRLRRGAVRVVEARLPRGLPLVGQARRWRHWIAQRAIQVVNAHASLDRHLTSYVRILGTPAAIVHTRRNVVRSSGGRLRARFDAATTDAIITVSESVRRDLLQRGVPAAHVVVVRNGIPLAEQCPPEPARLRQLSESLGLRRGAPVVGVVARRKSQEDLLRAAARLGRPLEILLVGIERDPALERLAGRLPEVVRVRFLGFRNDVPELLALLDVFVLPSRIEGFSLALLEAMARGLPCVAAEAGGNREALAGGAGILYPPGDAAGLAEALGALLDDAACARALGERAREKVRREFDVARAIEHTEALYARLVEARAA